MNTLYNLRLLYTRIRPEQLGSAHVRAYAYASSRRLESIQLAASLLPRLASIQLAACLLRDGRRIGAAGQAQRLRRPRDEGTQEQRWCFAQAAQGEARAAGRGAGEGGGSRRWRRRHEQAMASSRAAAAQIGNEEGKIRPNLRGRQRGRRRRQRNSGGRGRRGCRGGRRFHSRGARWLRWRHAAAEAGGGGVADGEDFY